MYTPNTGFLLKSLQTGPPCVSSGFALLFGSAVLVRNSGGVGCGTTGLAAWLFGLSVVTSTVRRQS